MHDACPPVFFEDHPVRGVHCMYLHPTIPHGWGGPVPGMAFRAGMTHAIPTCCQFASGPPPSEVSILYVPPSHHHTWLAWPRSGHGISFGDESRYPTCCQQLLRRRTPLTHCGACWDKCDWCQLRPRLCKWGLWIQRHRKPHSTSALVGY